MKYGVNWANVIIFELFVPFIILLGYKFHITLKILFFLIFYIYFCSIFIFRFFYFYDDCYVAFFPTRPFINKIKIFYSEIEEATYVAESKTGPSLMIARLGHKGFYGLRYDIPCNSKKAKKLMLFLKSKGIKIKIDSYKSLKKYEEILKDEKPEKCPFVEYRL